MARKRKHPLVGAFLSGVGPNPDVAYTPHDDEETAVLDAITHARAGDYIIVSQIVSVRRVVQTAEEASE